MRTCSQMWSQIDVSVHCFLWDVLQEPRKASDGDRVNISRDFFVSFLRMNFNSPASRDTELNPSVYSATLTHITMSAASSELCAAARDRRRVTRPMPRPPYPKSCIWIGGVFPVSGTHVRVVLYSLIKHRGFVTWTALLLIFDKKTKKKSTTLCLTAPDGADNNVSASCQAEYFSPRHKKMTTEWQGGLVPINRKQAINPTITL